MLTDSNGVTTKHKHVKKSQIMSNNCEIFFRQFQYTVPDSLEKNQ